jgi:hypothetical protein
LGRRHRVATEGGREAVQVKRLISERIRKTARGIDFVADVNADISVNVAEGRPGTTTSRSTRTSTSQAGSRGTTGRSERDKEEQ